MWNALFILITVHNSSSPGTEAIVFVHSLDSELYWKSEVKKTHRIKYICSWDIWNHNLF